ncbi:hypothetical protein GR183_20135 [Stappia sp. GBMRC 2046]|uniref:Calcineurin-like phosphoesterase domain-containing protein n=1 Tax=Stappia sediminis TaxID=2692190 RepID=A0A7X3LY45_9HYPH|nr:metallophosphoesterase family protein [Stappia sediminis]MXN67223.1 hypothetical protein [Stappia sediminis]
MIDGLRQNRASLPPETLIYVIGDVHGCLDLLEGAIAAIEADRTKRRQQRHFVVTLGDCIDRGPQSAEVLERLANNPFPGAEYVALLGNHEQAMLGFLEEPERWASWLEIGGLATLESYGISMQSPATPEALAETSMCLGSLLPERHRAFLQSLQPFWSVGDYYFVHAGIRPGTPLDRQSIRDLVWIRTPFLDTNEEFTKVIVHGHTPVPEIDVRRQRINIDTGAYFTGNLSVLVLSNGQREALRIIQPAHDHGKIGKTNGGARPSRLRPSRAAHPEGAWRTSGFQEQGAPNSLRRVADAKVPMLLSAAIMLSVGLCLAYSGVSRAMSAYNELTPLGLSALVGRESVADGSKRLVLATRLTRCRKNYFSGIKTRTSLSSQAVYRSCQKLIADYNGQSPGDPYGWLNAAAFAYEADGVGLLPVELLRMAYKTGRSEGSGIARRIVLGFLLDSMLDEELRERRRADLEVAVRDRLYMIPFIEHYMKSATDRRLINSVIATLPLKEQEYLVAAIDHVRSAEMEIKAPKISSPRNKGPISR